MKQRLTKILKKLWGKSFLHKLRQQRGEHIQSPIIQKGGKLVASDDLLMTSTTDVHFVDG